MSILGGLATGSVAYATFQVMLPTATDVKAVEPDNRDVESSRKTATVVSLGIVGGISLIARDTGIFIIGGAITVALSYLYAHANMVNPLTGKVGAVIKGGLSSVPGQVSSEPGSSEAIYVDENIA
jgi:hypothetical protein